MEFGPIRGCSGDLVSGPRMGFMRLSTGAI